jgi:tetratricopeptide (TPR) repeat protein
MEAYDLYLRARTRVWPPTRGNVHSAQNAFAHVIDLDPSFAGGHAGKSIAHALAVLFGRSDAPKEDARIALELAERAVSLDAGFARSHSALGTSYTAMGRHDEAVAAARRAIELQPGDADSHAHCARCLMWSGAGEEAAEMVRTALRLDPRYVEGPYLNLLGRSLFLAGHYADSIAAYERNRDRGGPHTGGLNWISACGHAGRMAAARTLVAELLGQHPDFSLAEIRDHREALCEGELEPLVEGLRKAGLPE